MRRAVAIVTVGVALAGSVYLASLNLNPHGRFLGCKGVITGFGSTCGSRPAVWEANRAVWQIPVAIVIMALGLATAVVILQPQHS
ncbi:MAG TPA: hypothetical protein VKR79_11195 [Gaiellaceae bacterium]|nr:hypothetical protein [Gaiellaceae bacterium]